MRSVGDYASGTNHVLPTYGYARMYSGVSLDSFLKKITARPPPHCQAQAQRQCLRRWLCGRVRPPWPAAPAMAGA